jgi:rod shape-determining protein MreD
MRMSGSNSEMAVWGARRAAVPVLSTLAASLVDTLPIVANAPVAPDFGFLVLLAWRLLRPEMWSAQVALPLGLFNDLVAGHPLGQSMALWTLAFLACDLLDSRVGWRDYWLDWLFAAAGILGYAAGCWGISRLMGSVAPFDILVPQILLSIFLYPFVARLVVALDRWRLAR